MIIGTGLAGLTLAIKLAPYGHVVLLSKAEIDETNTSLAQGGISSVSSTEDSFDQHILDTLNAGAGLCHEEVVRQIIKQAPERIDDLKKWGVLFDSDLTIEGGHSKRRVHHVHDETGKAIEIALLNTVKNNKNIEIKNNIFAIDLITSKKVTPFSVKSNRCLGVYGLNCLTGEVSIFRSKITALATGGAGKAYLYTSNWSGATGDGIAMAYRAGARVANLEFMQFHPTCLYHPSSRNFLITEALRGEGAELVDASGVAFMKKYHPMGSLAPRDIVARSIDNEMKLSGADCVYLNISHHPKEFIKKRFPAIYEKCFNLGIDISKNPLPVVPAAHYLCGGILTDLNGQTDIPGLFAFGENGCTGFHGANRLASNSLLECLAVSHNGAEWIKNNLDSLHPTAFTIPDWIYHGAQNKDEMIVIKHMWDEIRTLMWNYVGIVRSNRRLLRAQNRLENILSEIKEYYWNFKLHTDILELRNIAIVADLTVKCALMRKESRGIHYNLDFPDIAPSAKDSISSISVN